MSKNPDKKWDRCLYCDASIAGDDAHVASLHDPYCPHGKSLLKLDTLSGERKIVAETCVELMGEKSALDVALGDAMLQIAQLVDDKKQLESRLDELVKVNNTLAKLNGECERAVEVAELLNREYERVISERIPGFTWLPPDGAVEIPKPNVPEQWLPSASDQEPYESE